MSAEPAVLRMGRDITRQFAHLPPDRAAAEVAAHLGRFWEPRLRRELVALLADATSEADPVLRAAAGLLGAAV